MMSLSNSDTDEFKPLAVNSLESFDDELSNAARDSEPDFERFKLLIDQSDFDRPDPNDFKALYQEIEEKEEVVFKPLFERKKIRSRETAVPDTPVEDEDIIEPEQAAEPEETAEEKGYREGFEKGLKQGEAKGYDQGLEKGLKQGEEKGLEQGEKKGLEQGTAQGVEQGLKEGEIKGMESAKETAGQIIESLEQALNSVEQTLDKLVDVYEERIIAMIQQIAQKTVMAKIEMDEEVVRPLVIDTFKHLVQPEDVVLSVSIEDYEYIEMIKDEFFDEIESLTRVSVRSDPAVKRGGCKIETNTATVSTDVESRMQAIFDAMKNAGDV